MNIGEFAALDRESQFAEAGRIAGVAPSVFDGMWRTESRRGVAMLSPAGAEGHFGLMRKTRATMEGRFGSTIDPHSFGQSLYTAAHLLKENLGRFKNLPDALRAYNGGWNPATWGNKETAAYAGKVLGTDLDEATDENASTAVAAEGIGNFVSRASAESLVGKAFPGKPSGAPTAPLSAVAKATAALSEAPRSAPVGEPATATTRFTESTKALADAQLKEQRLKDETSFLDASRAAAFSTAPVALLQSLNRDPEPVDPNFVVPEEAMKNRTSDEQKSLAVASSKKQLDRLVFEMDYAKEQDEIAFRNGTVFGLGASFLAAGPEAMLSGGIASLAFRGAALSSAQLAARGLKGSAIASSTVEGVVGNVINTAALDMLGKRQGVEAYGLGVAGGFLNPLMQGRYLGRVADRAVETQNAERILREAGEREAKHMTVALTRLPAEHTQDELRAMMNTVEAEGIRAEVASHSAAIPDNRKLNVGEIDESATADAALLKTAAESQNPAEVLAGAAPKVASADTRVGADGEALSTAKQTPRWESPSFQSDRMARLQSDTEWQARVAQVSDGQATGGNLDNIVGIRATDAVLANPTLKRQAGAITELAEKYGLKNVLITDKVIGAEGGVVMSFGDKHIIGLAPGQTPSPGTHTAFHELGHAIYHQHAPTAPPELMARIHADWEAFAAKAKKGDPKAWEDRWALTSPNREAKVLTDYTLSRDEYMAEQYVKHLQSAALAGQLGGRLTPGVIKQITDAVSALWNYVADLVRGGHLKPGKAADEFFKQALEGGFQRIKAGEAFLAPELKLPTIDELGSMDTAIPPALSKEVNDFLNDPVAQEHGLDRLPLGTPVERAEAKQILALYKKALSPEYVIDEKRLSTLLSKVDALNPTSNMMLRSKNPVVRMAAIELIENGAGAAGRRSTAAIAKYMNERAIVGNAIVDMDREFGMWFKTQEGASHMKEAFTGQKRAEFNRLVAEEIEQRRYPGTQNDFGTSVRNAADAMEGSFERTRLMQLDAKTAGWAALPESSRGYMPHRIKSLTYRSLTDFQKRALHGELTDQFITISGFDPSFSDQLASKYLDRVNARALGGFDAPMGMHQVGAADVIKEALEQMNLNRQEIDAMMKRHSAAAASHTKKRLNIDLRKTITAEDGSTFRLLDLYDTDMLSLMRGQSQRVSGEVALARHGVMGKPGLAILRRAMGYGSQAEQAAAKEIGAFDQISAEFLGQPFGTTNKWVDRATQFNSVSSLGGMGFNQLAELINMGTTLGVKSALSSVASFGRLRSEILASARGGKVNNELLSTMETMGGAEFGTDAYKMVFPLDNPDLFANSMGADSISAGDRLLRGAGHLQAKLSLWRTIHSTQVRATAEQIVLKAAKALKEGNNDFHLRDMGMDDDMLARLRKDANSIVKMKDGRVTGFDITKATDTEAANAFIQSVHRGASQIIQGTFIGETGAFVHNSWLRLLTQFRGFSITAIDKQFNRQLGNRGGAQTALITLAAMSVAAPIYMLRTYAASLGRADQEEYLEKHLSFGAIGRATTNYIATSGLAGDFLDAASALTGTGEFTGGRSGTATTLTGNLIAPAAGKVDKLWGAVQNTKDGTDPHALIKELPLSRLPFFIPAINSLSD